MVEVIRKERKSSILTPSSIPCLRKLPTINITQGCSLGCVYCYIKSKRVASALQVLDVGQRTDEWSYQEFTDGCSGGASIGEDERKARFERLSRIARQLGLTLAPCACKNPGLTDGSCHIAGSTAGRPSAQAELPFP